LYYNVIQRRQAQLDQIRQEFSKTPIMKFLQERPYLIESVFPRQSELGVPATVLLQRIELQEGDAEKEKLFQVFKNCLSAIFAEGNS